MRERRRYRVFGDVQGVGYRAFAWREALRIGVAGWVRNRVDGSVEVLAEGSALQHDQLTVALAAGPRMSSVERVEQRGETADGEPLVGFTVLGDA
ncbi:MAG TPA: acylphosphatase [Thermoanaerobaculales bacterium]|nr:acylphosphatase [Thermoanaerobaculales bacterium]HPA80859.1 acylphosphatase [Thermoanaerobaculales bacterium]HQL30684.1 acylphosphatase [Thermoanaerobaculales bacterium]HQN96659.1 acylphosphatase [Thermoanaerobaculales bacterium]HQP44944.1 acylphosphatase [Thermoanaerobaculales bacterium]